MRTKNSLFKSLSFISLYCIYSMAFSASPISTNQTLSIAKFSIENLEDWKAKSFKGNTQYSIVVKDGASVLKAESKDTASGLATEQVIDLFKTPFLNWSWNIENTLSNLNETTKDGDDYAARIYVVKSGGWKIWNTKALNYVWSSNQEKGSSWNNAFVGDNAKMLAVKGQADLVNTWVTEKRNVYQDLIELYGDQGSDKKNEEAYRYIDAVALMTDTDNGHQEAVAYYGDIYFSAQ